MASSLMHLYVGDRLVRRAFEIKNPAAFYLGCVAPDAVNAYRFAPAEVRWASHLRDADLSVWKDNLSKFFHYEAPSFSEDLLLGYAIHILTDILWDQHYQDRIWREVDRLQPPHTTHFSPGWEDCFRFDRSQLRREWWLAQVEPALEVAIASDIHTITRAQLEGYRRYLLRQYASSLPHGAPCLVTERLVAELAERVEGESRAILG